MFLNNVISAATSLAASTSCSAIRSGAAAAVSNTVKSSRRPARAARPPPKVAQLPDVLRPVRGQDHPHHLRRQGDRMRPRDTCRAIEPGVT
jgi:hypothetical protein